MSSSASVTATSEGQAGAEQWGRHFGYMNSPSRKTCYHQEYQTAESQRTDLSYPSSLHCHRIDSEISRFRLTGFQASSCHLQRTRWHSSCTAGKSTCSALLFLELQEQEQEESSLDNPLRPLTLPAEKESQSPLETLSEPKAHSPSQEQNAHLDRRGDMQQSLPACSSEALCQRLSGLEGQHERV